MKYLLTAAAICTLLATTACNTIDDDRLPTYPVMLSLVPEGVWSTYGPSGIGDFRYFIKEEQQPRNFPYTDRTYTGVAGILLVKGIDPFTTEADVPLAYDLCCPVERRADTRVQMQGGGALPEAVCPVCGSHYDVIERGGAPKSGPALAEKYGLKMYQCLPGNGGGYVIVSK